MGGEPAPWVILGRISGVFGVQGWVRVYSNTQPREGILTYPTWFLGKSGEWAEHRVVAGRTHGKGVLARLEGSSDRDSARMLMGMSIAVPRAALPATEPGEYYWSDLIGMKVRTEAGHELGAVDGLMETGANDVLVVKGQRERLIPFLMDDVVKSVDLGAGLLIVDWDPDF